MAKAKGGNWKDADTSNPKLKVQVPDSLVKGKPTSNGPPKGKKT